MPKSQCQNCDAIHDDDDLDAIDDVFERVEVGSPMPSGECPECSCLCHPVLEIADALAFQGELVQLEWQIRNARTKVQALQEFLVKNKKTSSLNYCLTKLDKDLLLAVDSAQRASSEKLDEDFIKTK